MTSRGPGPTALSVAAALACLAGGVAAFSPVLVAGAGAATWPAAAHEAWLLEPSEIAHLSEVPLPGFFANPVSLGIGALVGAIAVAGALHAEGRLRPAEARLFARLAAAAPEIGPLVIRISLAVMLLLASLGGLPRHGTTLWAEPTLFVPDMQLGLAPGWGWLGAVQAVLAVMLAVGFLSRLAGIGVVALAFAGLVAFGVPFLSYAAHFVAPGLVLAVFGGGRSAADRTIGVEDWGAPTERTAARLWTAVLVLTGGGFVYLALAYKLTQPMLLITILEHGGVPLLGLPVAAAALVMTGGELIAGGLLAFGRLVRPVSAFLIGAFTFFALVLGEMPLFHANLYGVTFMLLLTGRDVPALCSPRRPVRGLARRGAAAPE